MKPLRVLLFQRGELWVAQCLEYDIAAQGKNPNDAAYQWERAFVGQIVAGFQHDLKPMANVLPAPPEYEEMFNEARFGNHARPKSWELPPSCQLPPLLEQRVHFPA